MVINPAVDFHQLKEVIVFKKNNLGEKVRLFILSLLLLAEIIIESSILPFIKIKGVTPDLVLITIVSMGLYMGKRRNYSWSYRWYILRHTLWQNIRHSWIALYVNRLSSGICQ